MSKSKAMEEMLADAFADMKTGCRVFAEISKENRSLADKLAAFTQKLLDGVKKFFHSKEVHEKYPSVTLTSKQFKDFFTRIDENICSMQDGKNKATTNSTGYKILQAVHSLLNGFWRLKRFKRKFMTRWKRKFNNNYRELTQADTEYFGGYFHKVLFL